MKHKKILLSVLVSALLMAALLTQAEPAEIAATLSHMQPGYLLLGLAFYTASYLLKALRLKSLLGEKISFKELASIVCVQNMMINIMPARSGELSYIYLAKKSGVPVSDGVATLLIVRLFDAFAISLLFFASLLSAAQLPSGLSGAVLLVSIFLLVLVVLLLSLAYSGELIGYARDKIAARKNTPQAFLAEKITQVAESSKILRSKKTALHLLLISVLIWVFVYLTTYCLLVAMGLELGIGVVVLGSTLAVLSTLLPINGFGGFGTYETAWALAFVALGLPKEAAITSGFSIHIVGLLYTALLGALGVLGLRKEAK